METKTETKVQEDGCLALSRMVQPYRELGLTRDMVLQGLIDSGLMEDIQTITAKGLEKGIRYRQGDSGKFSYVVYPESIQDQLASKASWFVEHYGYMREVRRRERKKRREERKAAEAERAAAGEKSDRQAETPKKLPTVEPNALFPCLHLQEFVVLDTETTGLSAEDEIIEVGITDMYGKKRYQKWFHPEVEVNPYASAVNHMTRASLQACGKRFLAEDWKEICSVMRGKRILGHNIEFDKRMFSQTLRRYGIDDNTDEIFAGCYDSKKIAQKWIHADSYKLENLAKMVGMNEDESHEAVGDCVMTAKFIRRLDELIQMRIRSDCIKL